MECEQLRDFDISYDLDGSTVTDEMVDELETATQSYLQTEFESAYQGTSFEFVLVDLSLTEFDFVSNVASFGTTSVCFVLGSILPTQEELEAVVLQLITGDDGSIPYLAYLVDNLSSDNVFRNAIDVGLTYI